ncbi:MAG: type 1 glutamine amidotransferase domain-containing protein, partial [Nakamurella sp.]
MPNDKRVLLALTSHDDLGGRRKTGYYVGEAAHPWREFVDAGFTVDVASVAGGSPPQDGLDESDPIQRQFLSDERMAAQLDNTPRLDDIAAGFSAAVVLVGGPGTLWYFPHCAAWAALGRDVYEAGGVVAA